VDLILDVRGREVATHRMRSDALVALMSFAVARGFGSQHPLIALADLAHDAHRVSLGPLTTFYDATTDDAEDVEKLELAWQPAGPLAASLASLADVLAVDPVARALRARAGACTLPSEVAWLRQLLAPLADGTPVRLSYTL
jgi:hypothetical protein